MCCYIVWLLIFGDVEVDDMKFNLVEKLFFGVLEEEEDEEEEEEFDDVLVEFGVLGFFLFSEYGFFYCFFLLGRSDLVLSLEKFLW